MAITASWYNRGLYKLALQEADWVNDTIRIILLTSSYTPDVDADHVYSDISANELSTANGYTAGGQVITTPVITEVDASDHITFTCDDVLWTASGGSIGPFQYAALYNASDASSSLWGYIDLGTEYTVDDGGPIYLRNIESRLVKAT